jgi:hypothetical protein
MNEETERDTERLVDEAVGALRQRLRAWDYEVSNETELCHTFFLALAGVCESRGLPPRGLKAEIRVRDGSVDLGIRVDARSQFDVMLEAKTWLRPIDASAWSKRNQATSKRNQCVRDALRLVRLVNDGTTRSTALLILERSSSHIRRLLKAELEAVGLSADERWIDVERLSNSRRKEHVGILWVRKAPHNTALDRTAGPHSLAATGQRERSQRQVAVDDTEPTARLFRRTSEAG